MPMGKHHATFELLAEKHSSQTFSLHYCLATRGLMTSLLLRKDTTMSEETKQQQRPQELKQSVLDRMDATRKAVEELSEEELESIVGGGLSSIFGGLKSVGKMLVHGPNHPMRR
jgi:bacteriocin-like protein